MRRVFFMSVSLLSAPLSFAAGFGTPAQGASGLGTAYAGIAASALDATTIFANPAGMTYLPNSQFVIANHLLKPEVRFKDEGSVKASGVPSTGGQGGDIGSLILMPNIYYSHKISEDLYVGIGVNSPFGLKTEYENDWIGRFQTVKSQLKTININPSVAFKVNDRFSVGAGISVMRAEAELTRAVNRVVLPESYVSIKGDDWGAGFNLGGIYKLTSDTRIGISYRSKVDLNLDGDAKFGSALSNSNTDVKTKIVTPESISVSSFTQLNDSWDLLADITWTRWSRFQEINILKNDGSSLTNLPQNWRNTVRYSIGAVYKLNDEIQLRSGLAFDQEAISDEYRQARIPSNDRTWLSFGASWKASKVSKLDFGFTHIFIKDAKINQNQNTAALGFNGALIGEYDAEANIVAIQFTRHIQ